MITLRNAEFFSNVLASAIAYFLITIFTGYFQAWVAKKLGDDTAEEAGFLSLNPLVYIDWIGFVFFLIGGFGWGNHVPINPDRFRGKFKYVELAFTYASRSISLCVVALLTLMLLVFFFGGYTPLYYSAIPPFPMPAFFVKHPALTDAIRLILGTMATFSIFFAFYSFIIALLRMFLFSVLGHATMAWTEVELISLLCLILLFYFFAGPLIYIVLIMIRSAELGLWHSWSWLATALGFISWYI